MPSSPDYLVRRGEISAYGRAMASSRHLRLLFGFVGLASIALVAFLALLPWPVTHSTLLILLAILVLVFLAGLLAIYYFVNKHFIEPDLAFRMWLQQVCDGNLDARIGLSEHHRHYKELNFHTRNLASSLSRLSDDMDSLVESQTRKLKEQKSVMELLFNITADVSSEARDEAAFATVCQYLVDWFDSARVSCYAVHNEQNALKRVSMCCSDDYKDALVPAEGAAEFTLDQIPSTIAVIEPRDDRNYTQTQVPFFSGDQAAGMLVITRRKDGQFEHSETQRVLTTVSEQLSLLCSQQTIQAQVLNARLSRDRNEMAAEIHDSLAQTLLAMRYQTTLLSEKLKSLNQDDTYQDVLKIKSTIEEANEEVRGLIREYRVPLSEHRYADALQKDIDQFSKSSGMPVFFQTDDPGIRFIPREEAALQRIIGEALNNARKYSKASMIRVYLNTDPTGVRRILVEDDGVGFNQLVNSKQQSNQTNDNAEQIGLTIMQERALSIGAKLTIDSEVGDGTRIAISMPPIIERCGETV